MPYKNPENKRQWEREHREHRNAQRKRRLEAKNGFNAGNPRPDPLPDKQRKNGWKTILGLAIGLGIVLLGSLGGANLPGPGSLSTKG